MGYIKILSVIPKSGDETACQDCDCDPDNDPCKTCDCPTPILKCRDRGATKTKCGYEPFEAVEGSEVQPRYLKKVTANTWSGAATYQVSWVGKPETPCYIGQTGGFMHHSDKTQTTSDTYRYNPDNCPSGSEIHVECSGGSTQNDTSNDNNQSGTGPEPDCPEPIPVSHSGQVTTTGVRSGFPSCSWSYSSVTTGDGAGGWDIPGATHDEGTILTPLTRTHVFSGNRIPNPELECGWKSICTLLEDSGWSTDTTTETLSEEYTTAMLIDRVHAAMPAWPENFSEGGGCQSYRNKPASELSYSETQSQGKFTIPDAMPTGKRLKIQYWLVTTPLEGAVTSVEGNTQINPGDKETAVIDVPVPTENATVDIVRGSYYCEAVE